jgi:hypothetical protein
LPAFDQRRAGNFIMGRPGPDAPFLLKLMTAFGRLIFMNHETDHNIEGHHARGKLVLRIAKELTHGCPELKLKK